MRPAIAVAVAATVLAAAGAAAAAPSVEIRDAVARVTVVPEDRADVKVEMLTTNAALPLQIRTEGMATVISGGLAHRIHDCHTRGDHPTAWVGGIGSVDYKDMPQVVIHTPRAVVIEAGGSVYGSIGRAGSLDLENSGCSAWTIADVAGDATLRESGKGSVRMGSSGKLDLRLSGAGSVHATQVRQGLDATLSGAGGGTIDDASISGLGDIRVKAVSGQVTKSISGGGHVTIG